MRFLSRLYAHSTQRANVLNAGEMKEEEEETKEEEEESDT
jgi:hypothetical protein